MKYLFIMGLLLMFACTKDKINTVDTNKSKAIQNYWKDIKDPSNLQGTVTVRNDTIFVTGDFAKIFDID